MFGAKELKSVFDIIMRNDMAGEVIYFSNLYYYDRHEEKQEILWIKLPNKYSVYSEIITCLNDDETKLFGNIQATTMVYLEMQRIEREFNK
jgi:hypothetical protein